MNTDHDEQQEREVFRSLARLAAQAADVLAHRAGREEPGRYGLLLEFGGDDGVVATLAEFDADGVPRPLGQGRIIAADGTLQ